MKKILLAFAFALAAPLAFGADARYTLTEYSKNNCPACVDALKDVDELTSQGIDVVCFNTDVDRQAAVEASRLRLVRRPAWRLARADGIEVGRWYGAGRSSIIAATIRAKFPAPDGTVEATPLESIEGAPPVEVETTSKEEAQVAQEPETVDAPEVVGAPLADFRERTPVSEPFEDAGFLDDAQDEWDARDRNEEDGEKFRREDDGEEGGDALFGRGFLAPSPDCDGGSCPSNPSDAALGDRIAERAARSILQGITPKLDAAKTEAFRKFDKLGADATGALEERVAKEFGAARAQLEKKFDGAVSELKRAVLREIGAYFWKAFFAAGLTVVIAVIVLRTPGRSNARSV